MIIISFLGKSGKDKDVFRWENVERTNRTSFMMQWEPWQFFRGAQWKIEILFLVQSGL